MGFTEVLKTDDSYLSSILKSYPFLSRYYLCPYPFFISCNTEIYVTTSLSYFLSHYAAFWEHFSDICSNLLIFHSVIYNLLLTHPEFLTSITILPFLISRGTILFFFKFVFFSNLLFFSHNSSALFFWALKILFYILYLIILRFVTL